MQPHDHAARARHPAATPPQADASAAIEAAADAAPGWRPLSFDDRCAVLLRAADLLAGPWRQRLNAATMLGQSKTAFQAEIDAACELIDFWRFNVHYAQQILADQPIANSPGVWNRTDHRPLEGFVYAITPFNFTAIAGNLPTAPALMGNTVIWKPSPTQQLAASLTMELLEEAGMPPGVINMLPGDGLEVSEVALAHPDLAGIHFTGSTPTFQHLWRTVGENIAGYRSYPRIVGETGGKDFIVAHPSADPDVVRDGADPRRVRVPGPEVLGGLAGLRRPLGLGARSRTTWSPRSRRSRSATPPTSPTSWARSSTTGPSPSTRPPSPGRRRTDGLDVVAGGQTDDSVGWFVRPTVVEGDRPDRRDVHDRVLRPDPGRARLRRRRLRVGRARQMESIAPYALTGAVIAQDRARDRLGQRGAALRRRQLLRQRQADRCRRRPAAVRRRPRLGHQRQGRRRGQPAALDLAALDQGDLRAADRLPLPVHGLRRDRLMPRVSPREVLRCTSARCTPSRQALTLPAGVRPVRGARP